MNKFIRIILIIFANTFILISVIQAGQFKQIIDTYCININTDTNAADFFPDSWLEEPINAKVEPVVSRELNRFPKILSQALSKYPVSVIKNNLKSINLAKSISFYDTNYGATSSNDIVYLTSKGIGLGYTDEYIESSFHHEFAHILKRIYNFPSKAWDACNPSGFKYRGSGVESIKTGNDSQVGDESCFLEGFLTEYSQSDEDEDFAVFSEWVFASPEKLKPLLNQYKNLRKKFDVWLKFEQGVSSYFTEKNLLN